MEDEVEAIGLEDRQVAHSPRIGISSGPDQKITISEGTALGGSRKKQDTGCHQPRMLTPTR